MNILRRPEVVMFCDMIIILTMFIKRIHKESRKVTRNRKYVSEWNLYLYFLMLQNLLICDKKW